MVYCFVNYAKRGVYMEPIGKISDLSYNELLDISNLMMRSIEVARRMEKSLEANEDYKNYHHVQDIIKCCMRTLGCIINSLEIAQLDKYQPKSINLAEYLEDLVAEFRARMRGLRINISFECENDIFVDVDADRLTACLANLIVNSLQNNDVHEDCSEIKITAKKLSDSVSLTVSDNGYGMDSGDLSAILDSDEHKGGLAVVKKFCLKVGTQIITDTNINSGFMISFRLPLSVTDELSFDRRRKLVKTDDYSAINLLMTKLREDDDI